jgi:hypothetical protein
MKLNIGCGEFYADGWTNMDVASNEQVRPDIIGSLTDLPGPSELANVEMVYLGHVLEHLPYATISSALRSLWPRCVLHARVAIVGPDVDRAAALHASGQLDWTTVVRALTGEERWLGDQHLWACNEDRLLRIVKSSGLKRVHPVPISSSLLDDFPVTSRAAWQCAIIGVVGS